MNISAKRKMKNDNVNQETCLLSNFQFYILH
jgi:hypothetical protein